MSVKSLIMVFGSLFLISNAYADIATIPSGQVQNLQAMVSQVQSKTNLPVVFPDEIPTASNISGYYASQFVASNKMQYSINVDSSANCNGMHTCNLGSITAQNGANPQIYYSMQNQPLTVAVKLANNTAGYFTPAHAMGDFWPAMLEWRVGATLYRLNWTMQGSDSDQQQALIAMANSTMTKN